MAAVLRHLQACLPPGLDRPCVAGDDLPRGPDGGRAESAHRSPTCPRRRALDRGRAVGREGGALLRTPPPPDLDVARDLGPVLRQCWGIAETDLRYWAEGAGAYHWMTESR